MTDQELFKKLYIESNLDALRRSIEREMELGSTGKISIHFQDGAITLIYIDTKPAQIIETTAVVENLEPKLLEAGNVHPKMGM